VSSRLKVVAISLLIIVGGALLWGVGIEPRLVDETRFRAPIPRLPQEWQGEKVAFIADMQLGMFLANAGTVRRIVDRLLEERPAVVLLGGDFLYHPTEDDSKTEAREEFESEDAAEVRAQIKEAVDIFRPLADAGIQTYAVLGNHDYAMQKRKALELPWVAEELARSLEEAGIPVLRNESVALKGPQGESARTGIPLYLVGIGAHYPDQDRIEKAFAGLPESAPRIVVMHNPESFAGIPPGDAPLAMAGHTHGGQIRIPFLPSWSWLAIVENGDVHTDGWIDHYGRPGNRLYVNRGIGFSTIPIRINCPPEVTFFTMTIDSQGDLGTEK